jgi:hypothetical protein
MLAEIFMVRLEARARLANETARSGDGRFVPFVQGSQVASKDQAMCSSPGAMASPDGIEPSAS